MHSVEERGSRGRNAYQENSFGIQEGGTKKKWDKMLRRRGFRFGFCSNKSKGNPLPCCLHLSMWFVLCETPRVYQSGFCNEPILSFCWMLYLLYVLFFCAHDLVRGAVEPMVDWYPENFVYDKLWFVFCKNRSARLKRLNALFSSKISAKFDLVCEWYSSQKSLQGRSRDCMLWVL